MPVGQLRIAMLSAHSCPVGKLGTKDTGGMSVYIREIACELGKQGHLVDVYTRVHDSQDRQIYELGRNARLIHLRAGVDEEIHKLALYAHLPAFDNNLESFRRRNNIQYDLIFSHYWLSALAGTHLQQRWRVPHIAMFHTLGAVKNAVRETTRPALGEKEPRLRIETEESGPRLSSHYRFNWQGKARACQALRCTVAKNWRGALWCKPGALQSHRESAGQASPRPK
jgi:D-inositol-3-phosphate glycosyltransferase